MKSLPIVSHPRLTRRTALQAGSVGLLGLGMNHVDDLRLHAAEQAGDTTTARAKSVIFVFLSGGLTQHESFDPKPKAPKGIRGEFNPISTATPGIQICEHLPMLAQRSNKWAILRSLTTPYNGHSSGHMALLSGRTPMPRTFNGSKPMPEDWPSIAAIVGDVTTRRNNNLPPAIVLPERIIHRTTRVIPGQFAGEMGSRRDPWFIEASPFNATSYGAYPDYEFHFTRGRQQTKSLNFQAPNLSLPQGLSQHRLGERTNLLQLIESQRRDLDRHASTKNFSRSRQGAISLLTDKSVQEAFDVTRAPEKLQLKYGKNAFGWSLLMAKRLVETGVNLVQVNLGNNETWDTHDNAFPLLKDCLLPPTDRGISALLDDLEESGLLDETLIVMLGEMGRTPKINTKLPGRDHWGAVQSAFFAGGGIKGGTVVGSSDEIAGHPASSAQRPENVAATIYDSLGLPDTTAWKDELNRPHRIYYGEPIYELL
ncbi:MAG: DUF1501 domain-containing protein [Planctomycetaceae bacterium]|jgi:hypothetical protein|nr:DUF1501 domain-containing protein [Planctomycetaceae bacterium]